MLIVHFSSFLVLEISSSIFVKMNPYFGPRGWTRVSTQWLYLGPVGADCDAVGRPMVARGREQNRNAGLWGTGREKARRRIEIRIDPRKSSGTRPTFDYSCNRSFLSLFSTFLLPLCSFYLSSRAFRSPSSIGSFQLHHLPRFPFRFSCSKLLVSLSLDFHFRRNP